MKQLLLSFLFFFITYNTYCKVKTINIQEIDSLEYYRSLANNPKTSFSLTKAYVFFKNIKEESMVNNDSISTIKHLRQIAIIQFELGDYYGSESTCVEALELLDTMGSNPFTSESKVGVYNQLGRLYRTLSDFDLALKYYFEALELATSKNNINIIQNNIALVYMDQLNYKQAEARFQEVYNNSVNLGDLENLARSLDNLGFVQSKLSNPEALDKLNRALELRIKIQDPYGVYASYKHLTQFYQDKNDLQKASFYADKAYHAAKQVNSVSYIEDALSNKLELNKDPEIVEYKKIKDSLANAKQIAENKYASVKFNYLKQEKIAQENMLQREKERFNKIIYQALGLFLFITSILFYLILKSRHRKDKLQVVYNTETRISKKVHDEVANDIYHVMNKLQAKHSAKETVLDDLEHIYSKTRDISKGSNAIDFNQDFTETLQDLLRSYKSGQVSVITKGLNTVQWDTVSDLKKTAIYRVLQELMTNMKKHSQATVAALAFHKVNNKLEISYSDNGIGSNLKKHNGLQNAENRIVSLNGTITFESKVNNGFKVIIKV